MANPGALLCPQCRSPYAPGATYCAVCGEPLDVTLVTELRYLYDALLALDKRIASGEGARTLTQLRDEIRPQYLADQAAATAPGATPSTEKITELRFLYRLALDLDARLSQGQGEKTIQELRDEISTRYLAERRGPVTSPAPAGQAMPTPLAPSSAPAGFTPYPYGPPPAPPTTPLTPPAPPARAFSFREFLADQAIAVMAYLGAFLMLVAALTFEIGAFAPEGLTNGVKLAVLVAVHLLFAVLGILFRRTERLRTVGGAYLFIFALMTPLVALGAYYWLLEGAISPSGMLTLSALYAALIYLFLAWRVKFPAYAYMGWIAFAIGMLALPDWLNIPDDWSYSRMILVALLMLLPTLGRRFAPLAAIAQPGRLLGGIATILAVIASLGQGSSSFVISVIAPTQASIPATRILVSASGLLLLALTWSVATRQIERRELAGVDLADVGVAAAIAYLAFSVGVAYSLDRLTFAWLLNGVAILEALAALALGGAQPTRTGLRRGIYGVAQALATVAALAVVADRAPNWPLIIAVATALAITLLTAFREKAPWWLVVSGVYLLWLYSALLAAFVTPDVRATLYELLPEATLPSFQYALLTLAVGVAGLALTWAAAARKYAAPVLLTAFFYGLITSLLVFLNGQVDGALVQPSAVYQTIILALFTALALLAGHRVATGPRANAAAAGNLFALPFGLLLPIPALIHAQSGVTASAMAVSVAIVALVIRRFLGRTWAITPYIIALWTTLLAIPQAGRSEADAGLYALVGVSLPVALLLVIAALATVAALWENVPAAMIAPAAIAWLALFGRIQPLPALVVALALLAMGAGLYQFRGRGWDIPWIVAGALGSFGPLTQIRFAYPERPYYQVAALLAFGVAVYLLALQRRASIPYRATLEPLAAFYGALAALAFPREDGYIPIVAYACVVGLLGAAVRLRLTRGWTLPLYGVAIFASAISFAWLPGYDANLIAAIFLVYAVVAIAPVVAERNPVVGVVPALYASGAVIVQSDARLLLPIAVGLTLVGVLMSRWLGRAWAAPWYTAALIASVATAIRGASYPDFNYLALLLLALVAYAVALVERSAWLTPLAALYGVWAVFVVPGPDPFLSTAAIAFGAILLGALISLLARWSRLNAVFGAAQGVAGRLRWTGVWYGIAVIASLALPFRSGAYTDVFYIALFALAIEVYLVALVERAPLLTAAAVLYGWWGALALPDVNRLIVTVALAGGVALLGGVVRLVAGRRWAISLYTLGALISLVSLTRIVPYDTNTMEVILLIYTAVAAVIALIEREPLAGIAPAVYASGVALVQTDTHVLLPVALGMGVVAMLLGRRFGVRWSLPWYIVTATASLATVIRGASQPDFEYIALIALTLLAYAIVAAEALPELLALPFTLGAVALIVTALHFELERWQIVLSLCGLAYLYFAGQWLWRAIPWLGATPPRQYGDQPLDMRVIGVAAHRWGGLVTAILTALGAMTLRGSFAPGETLTLAVGGSVLAVAGLLALLSVQTSQRGLLYLAGLVAAVAFSWGARWNGMENLQAYTLLPASYLLLVGALLPADKKLPRAAEFAAWAAILGSFTLLLPTFVQSFTDQNDTLYLLILVAEAVVVVAIGLGTRARSLLLIGAGFIGVAAIRGAVVAVTNNVPIFVVFAALALLLIGGATWLSLAVRRRPEGSAPTA